MKFIEFTAADGSPVEIVAEQVVELRRANPEFDAPHCRTVIILSSGAQPVREALEDVERRLGA